jgi:hypothetical protein
MDASAVSYFEQKFGAYDAEQLGELVSKRSDLSDEAIEALDHVLASKGLKDADVFVAPKPSPTRTAEAEKEDVGAQTKSARELWRSGLATTCKLLVVLTFIAPVQNLLKAVTLGAVWKGALVLVAGYAGYRFGHMLTRNICADADASVKAKRKNLWVMFAVLWPIYFLVYAISERAFGRG